MTERGAPATGLGTGYQVMLVALLSINFGIVFFDRNSLNFLMPYVRPDLGLNYTQVGILQSALSLTWACALKVSARIGSCRIVLWSGLVIRPGRASARKRRWRC